MPFGTCCLGAACEQMMELEKQWENPEPQKTLANGAEIITTKSILICKKSGQAIRAVKSGQDGAYAQKYAEKIKLLSEINEKYPGLIDILQDPYGSLYLNKGMYEEALRFLEDRIMRHGGEMDISFLYSPDNLEGELMRAALGHLLPTCDATRADYFIDGLSVRGVVNNTNNVPGCVTR